MNTISVLPIRIKKQWGGSHYRQQGPLIHSPLTPTSGDQIQFGASRKEILNAFFNAIESADRGTVLGYLATGHVNVNSPNEQGVSPLMMAIHSPQTSEELMEIITDLIRAGAKVDTKIYGRSLLHEAALQYPGDLRIATLLQVTQSLGIPFNLEERTPEDQNTALMLAARYSGPMSLQLLIDAGSKVNARNIHRETALYLAAASGSVEKMDILLKAGAHLNIRTSAGNTPLMAAARNNHGDVIRYLLAKGVPLEEKNNRGRTALFAAIDSRASAAVKALLEAGADPDLLCKEGVTPRQALFNLAPSTIENSPSLQRMKPLLEDYDIRKHRGLIPPGLNRDQALSFLKAFQTPCDPD